MGVYCTCPLTTYCDLENGFESVVVKSADFGENDRETPIRSISFDENGCETKILHSLSSGKLLLEASVRLRARKAQIMKLGQVQFGDKCKSPLSRLHKSIKRTWTSPILTSNSHEAAIKLQKVYKSFRIRRKLADCAVLIEQSWWKLLDFAELKHSSISFFELDKRETATSRWSRARTRAAKVGKGLSKNSKAQKLALQHWLEAIDPRHRYGHNLHFYYVKWLNSQSKEPFFYWLDIGEGREVNLIEKCPRLKLQQQCIKYLGPMERKAYEVSAKDGKFFYVQTGELINTTKEPKGSKWIFVLSTSKVLYVGKKKKGSFQHSSFLAGGATLAAGRIVADRGVLQAVWPHSGHYKPTPENFQDFISFLRENNVDLTNVKLESIDEEESVGKKGSAHLRSNSSEEDLTTNGHLQTGENVSEGSTSDENNTDYGHNLNIRQEFTESITTLQIPSKQDVLEQFHSDDESTMRYSPVNSPIDGYETSEDWLASDRQDEVIPEECILRRISSHKEMKSFQLGKHLTCTWSTGAGPRIGCVRDYPSGLQSHALEQVKLSPRSERRLRFGISSRSSTPNSSCSLSRATSRDSEFYSLSRAGSRNSEFYPLSRAGSRNSEFNPLSRAGSRNSEFNPLSRAGSRKS